MSPHSCELCAILPAGQCGFCSGKSRDAKVAGGQGPLDPTYFHVRAGIEPVLPLPVDAAERGDARASLNKRQASTPKSPRKKPASTPKSPRKPAAPRPARALHPPAAAERLDDLAKMRSVTVSGQEAWCMTAAEAGADRMVVLVQKTGSMGLGIYGVGVAAKAKGLGDADLTDQLVAKGMPPEADLDHGALCGMIEVDRVLRAPLGLEQLEQLAKDYGVCENSMKIWAGSSGYLHFIRRSWRFQQAVAMQLPRGKWHAALTVHAQAAVARLLLQGTPQTSGPAAAAPSAADLERFVEADAGAADDAAFRHSMSLYWSEVECATAGRPNAAKGWWQRAAPVFAASKKSVFAPYDGPGSDKNPAKLRAYLAGTTNSPLQDELELALPQLELVAARSNADLTDLHALETDWGGPVGQVCLAPRAERLPYAGAICGDARATLGARLEGLLPDFCVLDCYQLQRPTYDMKRIRDVEDRVHAEHAAGHARNPLLKRAAVALADDWPADGWRVSGSHGDVPIAVVWQAVAHRSQLGDLLESAEPPEAARYPTASRAALSAPSLCAGCPGGVRGVLGVRCVLGESQQLGTAAGLRGQLLGTAAGLRADFLMFFTEPPRDQEPPLKRVCS